MPNGMMSIMRYNKSNMYQFLVYLKYITIMNHHICMNAICAYMLYIISNQSYLSCILI